MPVHVRNVTLRTFDVVPTLVLVQAIVKPIHMYIETVTA